MWCGIFNNVLIGSHFSLGTVTGGMYLDFLRNILPGYLGVINTRGMIFQDDGAPPHFSHQVTSYLNSTSPNRWIGRGGPRSWPLRSTDLTPLDYFLWGHSKAIVYQVPIVSREQLIARINMACEQIRNDAEVVKHSVMHLSKRADKCIDVGGRQFEQLISLN